MISALQCQDTDDSVDWDAHLRSRWDGVIVNQYQFFLTSHNDVEYYHQGVQNRYCNYCSLQWLGLHVVLFAEISELPFLCFRFLTRAQFLNTACCFFAFRAVQWCWTYLNVLVLVTTLGKLLECLPWDFVRVLDVGKRCKWSQRHDLDERDEAEPHLCCLRWCRSSSLKLSCFVIQLEGSDHQES